METFKKILKGLWTFLNSRLFVLLLLAVIGFYIWKQISIISDYESDSIKDKQNIEALQDSLREERNRIGDYSASIAAFIASEQELKKLNMELYDALQAERGKVISLNQTIIKLIQDSVQLKDYISSLETRIDNITQITDSTFVAPWRLVYRYDEVNFDLFDGRTTIGINKLGDFINFNHLDTRIEYRESQISLIWGQKVENGFLRVFVTSSHPALTVASLSGVLIDPNDSDLFRDLMRKQKWFSGFSIGIGLHTGYDLISRKPALIVGPSINYNIYNFR